MNKCGNLLAVCYDDAGELISFHRCNQGVFRNHRR